MTVMQDKLDHLYQRIKELISIDKSFQSPIYEAALYSLTSSGKRVRPLLLLLAAEAFGVAMDEAVDIAVAIEFIHTYSLIHDDLPSMDNDDLRRGKPTLHKAFDEATAILTGDYLLTYAFEVIANAPKIAAEVKVQLISNLSQRIGAKGMIGGQVIDILSVGQKIEKDELLQMHLHKTADLISASLESAAILAKASDEEVSLIGSFGRDLGLAFQVIDDILEVTSTTETLGKSVESDAKRDKPNAVTVLGLQRAKELAKQLHERAFATLNSLKRETKDLKSFSETLLHRSF